MAIPRFTPRPAGKSPFNQGTGLPPVPRPFHNNDFTPNPVGGGTSKERAWEEGKWKGRIHETGTHVLTTIPGVVGGRIRAVDHVGRHVEGIEGVDGVLHESGNGERLNSVGRCRCRQIFRLRLEVGGSRFTQA